MLLPITRVLWPTDFSDASYEALKRALELCAHFSAELYAVHVVPEIPRIMRDDGIGTEKTAYVTELKKYEEELHKAARQRLLKVVQQRVPKGTKSAVIVSRGDPACQIIRTAEDERASLIVIATHGLTGWPQVMFGSVTERVVRVATCPVLTIQSPRLTR
jgi:nucleotide-binding universal stress UspA family protein